MIILLTVVHVIVCIVLILVILLQAGRGQGLTGPSFGSGNVQSLFGTGAADFLTKATSVSAIIFLCTAIALGYLESRRSKSLLNFSRNQNSPIDVDAIKKALDRVKKESAEKTQTATNAVAQKTEAAKTDAAKALSTLQASAQKTADSAAKSAETVVSDTSKAAESAASKLTETAKKA